MSTNPHMRANEGFTLVETMVAIAILTIAILGPFVAAQRSLDAAYAARDQLIASSLAQEGLEYVREVRDNNYLSSPSSYDPFASMDSSPDCRTPNACVVDPTQTSAALAIRQCVGSGGSCSSQPLYLTSAGIYNQQNQGTKTSFVRSVQLQSAPAAGLTNVVRATVVVSWTTSGKPYSMSVTEDFYDWL